MSRNPWSRAETCLLLAALGLLALALFGPALALPMAPHDFADRRTWFGVPHAGDVLSNLPFALLGGWGLGLLWRCGAALPPATRAMSALFLAGLLCTALGSAAYHWRPDDAGLALDRLGMGVAFAGLAGLAACGRVGARAGWATGFAVLAAAVAAVGAWHLHGELRPWAVVQFGGMALVLAMAALRPLPGVPVVRLGAVIVLYALAKVCELADQAVLGATAGWVSGHTLKHVVAAAAALPVLAMLQEAMPPHMQAVPDGARALRRAAPSA